jgi:UDP-glucose 4-epimerase
MAFSILLIGQGKLPPFILGNGKNRGGLVHVEDIVGAAEYLARHPDAAGEIFNVTDDTLYTVGEITRCLARALKIPFISFIHLPERVVLFIANRAAKNAKKFGLPPPVDRELINLITANSWISNEKLKTFGYQLKYPDTKIGLAETIEWYRKEGLI